jgi:glycerol-3-phosphate dehydrogenase
LSYRSLARSISSADGSAAVDHGRSGIQIPSRQSNLDKLTSGEEFDIIIVGGGATGAGAALDAAARGLKVACVEREDFASGTSSRSTKLLWGGSRYLVQALMQLFSLKFITEPVNTIKNFQSTFKMVQNCLLERKFLLETQPHLAHWVPIAVYHSSWFSWPPPFGYYPAVIGPMGLYTLFFKFYDFVGSFSSPPSHIMTPRRAKRKFPHLNTKQLKYASVFYEGCHDDARTNLAIAQTASVYGAAIANYVEVTSLIKSNGYSGSEVKGVRMRDNVSGNEFEVRGKSVLFCGGPFTDELLALENKDNKKVVKGASGVHIVLPGYYAPTNMGMVDMQTSDGRFLFFLPWMDHVVVGTTDRPADATMRPVPEEIEIQWILAEAAKYLNPELVCRRSDVLSAWSGVRPLAEDPTADPTSGASRDHVLVHNDTTGVTWISGGKWTTYREMAEDAVDKCIEKRSLEKSCVRTRESTTRSIPLVGSHGFSDLLPVRLVQEYGIAPSIAERLARAYGGRAFEVMHIERNELKRVGRGVRLSPGYPILEAEVIFAVRYDWCVHVEDFLARRTRLAFLNKDVAISCIPRVATVMAQELGWSGEQQRKQIDNAIEFLGTFGGDKPKRTEGSVRLSNSSDIQEAWSLVCQANPASDRTIPSRLDLGKVSLVAQMLEYKLTQEELIACLGSKKPTISVEEFEAWWNSSDMNPNLEYFTASMTGAQKVKGGGAVFG